jgi:Response regulator containing a CheY-like receiver domain and an HTH DNA-binding domain
MKQENPIRIVVADDHPIVREGLAAVLNAQDDMTVIGEAETGPQAVDLYRKLRPDILLLDLRLPEMDGVDVTIRVRKDFPRACVMILTTYSGDEHIFRALESGVRSYLMKTVPKRDLLEAIRVVHSGGRKIPAEVAARVADRYPFLELTPREKEVLILIIKGKSNKEIASALKVTESTVKYHISLIFTKLGVSARTEAATAALKRGIVTLD